jgi:hypothetical protein
LFPGTLEDVTGKDLKQLECDDLAWIDQLQDRDYWRVLVNTVMNLRAEYAVRKVLSNYTTGSFRRRESTALTKSWNVTKGKKMREANQTQRLGNE